MRIHVVLAALLAASVHARAETAPAPDRLAPVPSESKGDASGMSVTAAGTNKAATLANRASRSLNIIDDFGAKCDVVMLRHASARDRRVHITATSAQQAVNVANAGFTSSDVGKYIVISGIGPSGNPLASRIVAVNSSTSITLADPAQTSASSRPGMVAYGSDDSPAFAAAFAALPNGGSLLVPAGACGVAASITLPGAPWPASYLVTGAGRDASTIVALNTQSAVFQEDDTSYHREAAIRDLTLDAMGVANFAHDAARGTAPTLNNVILRNGFFSDLRIGNGVTNSSAAQIISVRAEKDTLLWPDETTAPIYNVLVNGSDNMLVDVIAQGASLANFHDKGAGNFYTNLHGFGPAQYAYILGGHSQFSNCEVDGATVAGLRIDTGWNQWMGGRATFGRNPPAEVYGIQYNTRFPNSIIGVDLSALPPTRQVANIAGGLMHGGRLETLDGLTPPSLGAQPGALIGITRDGATPVTLTSDTANQTDRNSIALGDRSATVVRGAIVVRDTTSPAYAAWEVSALIGQESAGEPPVIVGKPTITRIAATEGFSPGKPTIEASATSRTFAIKVTGVAARTLHWRFVPQLAGVN